jgi:hypothetical protein
MSTSFEMPQAAEKSLAGDSASREAGRNLFDAAYAAPEKVNIDKESSEVAKMLAAYPANGSLIDPVRRVSADLLQLADNPDKYNALLKSTSEKLEKTGNTAVRLSVDESSFNKSTGTYDNVTITARMHPSYRLVQPGLTLEDMTRDYIKADKTNNFSNPSAGLVKAVMNDIIKENSEYQKIVDIKNPDDIKVGQFLAIVSFPFEYNAYDRNGNLHSPYLP